MLIVLVIMLNVGRRRKNGHFLPRDAAESGKISVCQRRLHAVR